MGCFEIAACCVSQFTMAARLAQSVGMTCTLIGIRSVRGAAQPARAAAAKSAKNIRILVLQCTFGVLGTTSVVGLGTFHTGTKRQVTIKQFAMSALSGLFNYK
jgi:hypothetical protein